MTYRTQAVGLPANWLNGWLAAIGATVLVPGLRLGWADEPEPFAVYESDEPVDLVQAIAGALPTVKSLAQSSIARTRPDAQHSFDRHVTLEAYRERAAIERRDGGGHVAASVTDLLGDAKFKENELEHGAFDPSVSGSKTGPLWQRAARCAEKIPGASRHEWIRDSLFGVGHRMEVNGLGFDARRLPAGVHDQERSQLGKKYADPVVELMVFAALVLFPTRGDGRKVRQRGWRDQKTQRGAFEWSAWRPFLDHWAIDALLDMALRSGDRQILAGYRVVPYQWTGSDMTRAYFAERAR